MMPGRYVIAFLLIAVFAAKPAHGDQLAREVVSSFKALGLADYLLAHVIPKRTLVPGQRDTWAFPIKVKDRLVGYAKPTPAGNLSLLYDADGVNRGSPARLVAEVRSGLVSLGLLDEGAKERAIVDLKSVVPIPKHHETHGYRVTVDGVPVAFVKTSKGGRLSLLYDAQGEYRGNPHRLGRQARSSAAALGLIAEANVDDVFLDLAKTGSIPNQAGTQGYRMMIGQEAVAFIKSTAGGSLSRLYDAQGNDRGNPTQLVYDVRSSLEALGLIKSESIDSMIVTLSKLVPIPNQKDTEGHPVTVDGKIVALAKTTPGGHLSRLYDRHGRNRGDARHVISEARRGFVALKLVPEEDEVAERLIVDLSKMVAIPNQRNKQGHVAKLDDVQVGFVETTPGGHLTLLYDVEGEARGNPVKLLSQVRNSLIALKLADSDAADRMVVELSRLSPIPNQKSARGYPVTVDGVVVAIATASPGGHLALLYDAAGENRGNPAALTTRVRANLVKLEMVDAHATGDVIVDLAKAVAIPNRKEVFGYPVLANGALVAFAKTTAVGHFSLLYDTQGATIGDPLALASQTRTSLIALKLVNDSQAAKLNVDSSKMVAVPSQKDTKGHRVTLDGETVAFIKATPGGNLSFVYDAKGTSRGRPVHLIQEMRRAIALLRLARDSDLGSVEIDLSRLVSIPNQPDLSGYSVTLKGKPIAFAKPAPGGGLSVVHDEEGRNRGNPSKLVSDVRSNLAAARLVDGDAMKRFVVEFSREVPIPNQEDIHGYAVTVDGHEIAFVKTSPSGHVAGLYDINGANRGIPARLASNVRTSLVALDLIDKNMAERVALDFSQLVPIPHRKTTGHRVTVDDELVAFAKVSAGQALSQIYDVQGRSLGNFAGLISTIRYSLSALGMVKEQAAGGLEVDLSASVPIPHQGKTRGHQVTLDGKLVAFAKTAPGGALALIYGLKGENRGNPAQLIPSMRRSLVALDLVDEAAANRLEVDLSKLVHIPNRIDMRGYRVTLDGNVVAFVKASKGGSFSHAYDQH